MPGNFPNQHTHAICKKKSYGKWSLNVFFYVHSYEQNEPQWWNLLFASQPKHNNGYCAPATAAAAATTTTKATTRSKTKALQHIFTFFVFIKL